jgi:hypothetical protein
MVVGVAVVGVAVVGCAVVEGGVVGVAVVGCAVVEGGVVGVAVVGVAVVGCAIESVSVVVDTRPVVSVDVAQASVDTAMTTPSSHVRCAELLTAAVPPPLRSRPSASAPSTALRPGSSLHAVRSPTVGCVGRRPPGR